MRRVDDTPFDPEIAAQLDAIDATLAGDPVDPEHAELAELALLLAATRPVAEQDFARSLDERVAARFRAGEGSAESAPATSARSRRGWSWLGPLAGIGTAAVAAVVAVVVIGSGGTG